MDIQFDFKVRTELMERYQTGWIREPLGRSPGSTAFIKAEAADFCPSFHQRCILQVKWLFAHPKPLL